MITVAEYEQLVREVKDLETKEAKAEGALAELRKVLKEEFDCTTVKAAADKLKAMQDELDNLEADLDHYYQEYKGERDSMQRSC